MQMTDAVQCAQHTLAIYDLKEAPCILACNITHGSLTFPNEFGLVAHT